MDSIQQFIDRISMVERNGAQNVIIPLAEARKLRDQLTKLLLQCVGSQKPEVIEIELKGGKW